MPYVRGLSLIQAEEHPLWRRHCEGLEPVEAGKAIGQGKGFAVDLVAREEHAEGSRVVGVVIVGEAAELLAYV